MVRHLPGGEETMREMIAYIRQEDGTGQELNSEDYVSTRKLSDEQFQHLLSMVRSKSNAPRKRRRRSRAGNVTYMVTDGERKYINFMAGALGWSEDALQGFVARQTRGKGIRTHRQASAVMEPMERLLKERGWSLSEGKGGRKWWDKPAKKEAS